MLINMGGLINLLTAVGFTALEVEFEYNTAIITAISNSMIVVSLLV